jgi:hypothetical protein
MAETASEAAASRRPSWAWWLMEFAILPFLTAAIWFGSANQTSSAFGTFGLAVLMCFAAVAVRLVQFWWFHDRRSAIRWLVAPALVLGAWLARDPLMTATFRYRFSRAEATLTAAAQALMDGRTHPTRFEAGSFHIYDGRKFPNMVVFYAKGAGPLILKRCGFAFIPGGDSGLAHIDNDWYWFCRG